MCSSDLKPSDQIAPEDLQKMAQSDNPTEIEKQLTPVTGPVVAKQIAPAVAITDRPETVANAIDNAVNNKVPAPQIQDIQPPTPTSNVNLPNQVSAEEQSLYNSAPFMNAPGEAPAATGVTRASVMSQMVDMVNSGHFTNDEVLNYYFESMPNARPGEAQDSLDQVLNSAGIDKSKINASLNPKTGQVKLAPVGEGDQNGALINGRNAESKINEAAAPALKAMEALDSHDRELTRYLRGKTPEEVQAIIKEAHDQSTFSDYVQHSKVYNDTAQALGAEQGQPLPYNASYGGRTPYEPPEGFGDNGSTTTVPNAENPSYTKGRYFNTHEEALAKGYNPIREDPLEDLKSDVNQRALNNKQLALAQGYEQAFPGQVKLLNEHTPLPNGYHQLLVRGGEHIALPAEIADKINARVATTTPGKAGATYDTINQAAKELELGGGTFHGFNTLGTFVGQQLASAKALTDVGATAKVVANTFSDKNMSNYLDRVSDPSQFPSGGKDANHSLIDGANASGLNIKNTSTDLVNPGDKSLAGKVANVPVLKQIHDAVFNRQIPTMMLEQFRQKTEGLDIFGSADDRLEAEKIARGINKEFGVTDHDLAGLTNQTFKNASRVILAPGYQEGVIHTLATAFDPRSIGTAEGRLAREAVVGKALLFGGLATLGSAAGGDFNGMDSKHVALAIMNKAIDPSFNIGGYKVSTPATFISDVGKPIEQSIKGYEKNGNVLTGAQDFASSHLAAVPSRIEEFGANKDFSGNAVRGKDYYGRPISPIQTAETLAGGVLPIPVNQAEQAATGKESTGAAVANTVGLSVHPQNSLEYAPIAGQTYLAQLQKTPGISKARIDADTQFVEALGAGKVGRAKTLTTAESLLAQAKNTTDPKQQAQLTEKAVTAIDTYNKQLVQALVPWAQSRVNTSYLDSNMLSILRSTLITLKTASSKVNYDVKTNPTAYGVQVKPLASVPQTAGATN